MYYIVSIFVSNLGIKFSYMQICIISYVVVFVRTATLRQSLFEKI
jgi:hypothetical protein